MDSIEIQRGDTRTITVTFTDDDGDPIDLTDSTVFFTVKKRTSQTDAQAIIKKSVTSHTNPTSGISAVNLSTSDTDNTSGTYYYDFQVVKETTVRSTKVGVFIIKDDVTTRTS